MTAPGVRWDEITITIKMGRTNFKNIMPLLPSTVYLLPGGEGFMFYLDWESIIGLCTTYRANSALGQMDFG